MALNIKNPEVERLVSDLASRTGESKTEAIRQALLERSHRLAFKTRHRRGESFLRFLEEDIWPRLPPDLLGQRLTRDEEDQILGYGPEGV